MRLLSIIQFPILFFHCRTSIFDNLFWSNWSLPSVGRYKCVQGRHRLLSRWSSAFDLGASVRTLAFSIMVLTVLSVGILLIFGFFNRLSYNWDRTLLTGIFRQGRLGDKAPRIKQLTGLILLKQIMVFCLKNSQSLG